MADVTENQALQPTESNKALAAILLIVFVDLLGFGIILPQLPFYAIRYEVSAVWVTLLFSLYSLFQFLATPILGLFSDKFGRKPVLVFSQAGSALGYALLGIVTQLHMTSVALALFLIYLARIIDGISGGNISTAQAYISDVTSAKNRARGMGFFGAAFGVGFAVGPLIGGVVGNDTNHAAWPAFTAALFSAVAMTLSAAWLPESNSHRPVNEEVWLHPSRFKPIFARRILSQLLISSFLSMTAFTMLEGTIGLYLNHRFRFGPHHDIPYGQRQVGWYFGYIGLFIMYVQGRLMAQMVRRFGEWPVAIAGCLLVSIAMGIYMLTDLHPLLWVLLIAGAVNAIGRSLQQPPISSIISKISDRSEQGAVFGVYHGLGSLARSFGPVIAGIVYKSIHDTAQFALAGTMSFAVALWLNHLRQKHSNTKSQQLQDRSQVKAAVEPA